MKRSEVNYFYKKIYNDLNRALTFYKQGNERGWSGLIETINLNILLCNGSFNPEQHFILTTMVDNINELINQRYIECSVCKNFCKQNCFIN